MAMAAKLTNSCRLRYFYNVNVALQGHPLTGVPCKRLLGTKHGLIQACQKHV